MRFNVSLLGSSRFKSIIKCSSEMFCHPPFYLNLQEKTMLNNTSILKRCLKKKIETNGLALGRGKWGYIYGATRYLYCSYSSALKNRMSTFKKIW